MSEKMNYQEFLELEAADLNGKQDAFFERYGFKHDCRCDKDFAEDRTAHVPMCWVEMMDMAFDRLPAYRAFLKELATDPYADTATAEQITEFLNAGA